MSSQIDPSTVQDPELQARLADMVGVIKYSLIMVSMIPVLLIYPFVPVSYTHLDVYKRQPLIASIIK